MHMHVPKVSRQVATLYHNITRVLVLLLGVFLFMEFRVCVVLFDICLLRTNE